LPCWLKK